MPSLSGMNFLGLIAKCSSSSSRLADPTTLPAMVRSLNRNTCLFVCLWAFIYLQTDYFCMQIYVWLEMSDLHDNEFCCFKMSMHILIITSLSCFWSMEPWLQLDSFPEFFPLHKKLSCGCGFYIILFSMIISWPYYEHKQSFLLFSRVWNNINV